MRLRWLFLALVWVTLEFTGLIAFYLYAGFWITVAVILGTAVLGVLLFKWQMGSVWQEFKAKLSQAALPGVEAANGLLLFTAACLMISPFLLMDTIGLLLMIPFVRRLVAKAIRRFLAKRFEPEGGAVVFNFGSGSPQWAGAAAGGANGGGVQFVPGGYLRDPAMDAEPAEILNATDETAQATGGAADANAPNADLAVRDTAPLVDGSAADAAGADADDDDIEEAEFRPAPPDRGP